MEYTLLEVVQRLLSSIKGEEVNSITDTAESLICKDIVKEAYFNIITNAELPEHYTLLQLEESDATTPTLMTLPEDVMSLNWIRYDRESTVDATTRFDLIKYLEPSDFMSLTCAYPVMASSSFGQYTLTIDSDAVEIFYRDDTPPCYWTSFNDSEIIFDSYDLGIEAFLQKLKTTCHGLKNTAWLDDDAFEFFLDPQQLNILLKDAKAMAWMELRQTDNGMAMKEARKGRILSERKKYKMDSANTHKGFYYQNYPNYSRKG